MTIDRKKLLAKQIRGAAFDLPADASLSALISAFVESDKIPKHIENQLIEVWQRLRYVEQAKTTGEENGN